MKATLSWLVCLGVKNIGWQPNGASYLLWQDGLDNEDIIGRVVDVDVELDDEPLRHARERGHQRVHPVSKICHIST